MRRVGLVVVLLLGGLRAAVAGSPFYLTVERSFGTGERPVVRLDFTDERHPLVVRVLRPRDLEQFLDGQLNLSRSYEEPVAALNPGHYVVRGLNRVRSPLEVLRRALGVDFRKSFGGDRFNLPLRPLAVDELATPPAELSEGPPRGFDVVREEYVDLQKGGAEPVGLYEDVPWFGETRYRVRDVALDPLPDGLYLLQATQGRAEAQALLQVSDLAVQVKQSSTALVVRAIDRALRPVAGAAVAYRDGRGRWQPLPGVTDATGELRAEDPGRFDGRLVIRVSASDARSAITDTDFLPASADEESVFLVTDRPIFKPGERFFYKGTVRTRRGGALVAPAIAAPTARVRLFRAGGEDTGLVQDVPVTPYATFSGSFDLEASRAPGLYQVVADIDGKPYAGEFRVRDYVKPTFYLELLERDPTIRPGAPFHLRFRARRYAGGVAPGVRYEVFVYRKRLEAPAWVDEAGGGLDTAHDYFGAVRSATALAEPQRLYSSVEARMSARGASDWTASWSSAPEVGADGGGAVELTLPSAAEGDADRDWIYTVLVRGMDRAGAQAVLSENLYMTLADAVVAAQFASPVGEPAAGELRLALRATYPGGEPAGGASGRVEIVMEHANGARDAMPPLPFTADAAGRAELRVPSPASASRVRATAVLDAVGGKAFRRAFRGEPALALVAKGEGEAVVDGPDVELYPERTVLEPGGKTRVLALLPAGWGANESGVLWETIAGDRVFATRNTTVHGRSRWLEVEARPEYGTGFYHTVTVPIAGGRYAEQTLGFRIVPSDKRLTVVVRPASEVAEPLKPFTVALEVRDAAGAPAADVELSVNLVDRAVYAVQPEFRPGIVDFFYPLPRLNLATFYSDELQGYGYAAEITRPNFRLGALKSNVRPQKRDMRDTAGWFPHVVTDADGRASVTADMPANVTEWLVTAIAADRGGRVGEGTGLFRTATDLSIELLAPRFLRDGDAAVGQVEADNHTAAPVAATLTPRASGGVALEDDGTARALAIPAGGQALSPLRLRAPVERGDGVVTVAVEAPAPVRTGGPRGFDVRLEPAALAQVLAARASGDALEFPVPSAGTAHELRVRVLSGLLGAVLDAASSLVSYPYGCTEQLAHTTVPNLVLLDLVTQAGIDIAMLEPLGLTASVAQARENARLGVQRLAANQKADGGLALWPTDPQPSFPATAIAARALAFAARLNVDGARATLDRALSWLAGALEAGRPPADGLFGAYELELLNEVGLFGPTLERSVAFVGGVLENRDASLAELVAALRILRVRRDQYWFGSRLEALVGAERRTNAPAELATRLAARVQAPPPQELVMSVGELGFGFGEPAVLAGVLGALAENDALDDGLRVTLTRRLLDRMRGTRAGSTFQTAEVVFGARALLAREAEAARAASPRQVAIRSQPGAPAFVLGPVPGGFAGTLRFDPPLPVARAARLTVEGAGPDELAVASGITIERTLLRVEGAGAAPLAADAVLHRGDVIVSRILVRRDAIPAPNATATPPSRFVVLVDAVPSLGEAIDEDRPYLADAKVQDDDPSYWAQVKETLRHPDRTERVLELRPGASMLVHQVWRVAYGGRAALPPARAFDMYDDELAGNTAAAILVAE